MKIVIDANRIFAALIKDSTTRAILYDENFEFITPDFTTTELNKYKEDVKLKSKLDDKGFEVLLAIVFDQIIIVPETDYTNIVEKYRSEIKDKKDLPYLALCIVSKADGIWTHDSNIIEQKIVKVFTNIDMLRMSGQATN